MDASTPPTPDAGLSPDGSERPEAGWYDDPEASGSVRWWDGTAWGEALASASTGAGPPRPPAPVSPRHQRAIWLVLVLLGILILFIAPSIAHRVFDRWSSPGQGALPIRETFSASPYKFFIGSHDVVSAEVRHGAYRVRLDRQAATTEWVSWGREVDSAQVSAAMAMTSGSSMGVALADDPAGDRYVFEVSTSHAWEFIRIHGREGRATTLARGSDPTIEPHRTTTLALRVRVDGAASIVTAWRGKNRIARVVDHEGIHRFRSAGLVFGSSSAPSRFRVDDVRVITDATGIPNAPEARPPGSMIMHFSKDSGAFLRLDNESVVERVEDGHLLFRAKHPFGAVVDYIGFRGVAQLADLAVSFDVISQSDAPTMRGPVCASGASHLEYVMVGDRGRVEIFGDTVDTSHRLATFQTTAARGLNESDHLSLECRGSERGATLTAVVNGVRVGEAFDPTGPATFDAAGVFAQAGASPAQWLIDNFEVRPLSPSS